MGRLRIEVVFAERDGQQVVTLALDEGATAHDALRESGLAVRHPEVDLGGAALGIFGRRVSSGTPLHDGDRVEIYRPLVIDPKEARRAKVTAKKRSKR